MNPLRHVPGVNAIPAGVHGVDCNQPIDAEGARALFAKGFRFAVRYVGRFDNLPHDITLDEVETLFDAGLALMIVQHVESADAWTPNGAKGRAYGRAAAAHCQTITMPPGATVWCDLEGVAPGTPDGDVIAFAREWYAAVAVAGYRPGLYVGWHCGLTPLQLYQNLQFTRYWAAYNLNADQYPTGRGVCMKQHEAKPGDLPAGFQVDGFDTNTVLLDAFNALPSAYAPYGWAP